MSGFFRKEVDMEILKKAILVLEQYGELPSENSPHKLSGDYSGFWEAHIKNDCIMIWKTYPVENEIWLARTGTHSGLF